MKDDKTFTSTPYSLLFGLFESIQRVTETGVEFIRSPGLPVRENKVVGDVLTPFIPMYFD